jgi:hypothetical protein
LCRTVIGDELFLGLPQNEDSDERVEFRIVGSREEEIVIGTREYPKKKIQKMFWDVETPYDAVYRCKRGVF